MRTLRHAPRASRLDKAAGLRAFTLMELVVVVIVISTLSLMAAPKLANAIAVQNADAAARRIVRDLEQIRSRAIKTSTPQTFRLSTTTNPGYLLVGMQHMDIAAQTYFVSFAVDCHGVQLSSYSLGGDVDLIFDIYGIPDSAGQLVITRGGQQRTINIDSATGRISVS